MSKNSDNNHLSLSTTIRANQQWLKGLNNKSTWFDNIKNVDEDEEPRVQVGDGLLYNKEHLSHDLEPSLFILSPAATQSAPCTRTLRAFEITKQGLEDIGQQWKLSNNVDLDEADKRKGVKSQNQNGGIKSATRSKQRHHKSTELAINPRYQTSIEAETIKEELQPR
jgi:hypothetical protein